MSIISDLTKTSKTTRNQISRWRKRRIIPRQVLDTIWWEFGIKIEPKPPKTGMGLMRFLDLIWQVGLSEQDSETSAAALFIYEDTVKSELMPNWKLKMKAKKPRIVWPEKKDKSNTIIAE